MAFTNDDKNKLDAVYTGMVGVGGKGGLIDQLGSLTKSHYNLKRTVYVLIALLFGGGGITGIVLKAIEVSASNGG